MNQQIDQFKVAIVIVPRERFSLTEQCVEHIYAHTQEPFELFVIDSNSPKRLGEKLKKWETRKPNCKVIRLDRFVYPHEAKNIAVQHLSPGTEWIAFVDSDVKVGPGWLGWMLDAAKETGARVIHPLYYIQQGNGDLSIHMADGIIKEFKQNGSLFWQPIMNYVGLNICHSGQFTRKQDGFLEFHTFMIHQDIFKLIAEFEPLTLSEDVNYSFRLRELGEKIVFEPRSVITYVAGPPFEKYDLPYFKFRWNPTKSLESINYLKKRWPVKGPYWDGKLDWARFHRSRVSPTFKLRFVLTGWGRLMKDLLRKPASLLVALFRKGNSYAKS